MKQQRLLFLAMVGMSLGALADCESDPCSCCYGHDSSGNTQTESINNYCSVSDLKYACKQTQYSDGSSPCYFDMQRDEEVAVAKLSFVTNDLCRNDVNCYGCKNFDDTDYGGYILYPGFGKILEGEKT